MPAGQPTKYKESYNELAEKACAIYGSDDKKLAEFLGVTEQTVNNWKEAHLEFFESLKRGKDVFDTEKVEKSLLQRALGYSYTETHTEETKNKKGGVTKTKTKTVKKHMPTDPTSCIFWLKNRNKVRWKDIKAVASTDDDGDDKKYPSLEEWRKANAVEE